MQGKRCESEATHAGLSDKPPPDEHIVRQHEQSAEQSKPMNWDDYDVFCHVIEHHGFTAAARVMERPKSSISAAVGRLEAALGTRLIERTTRQVRLTEPGQALYGSIAGLFSGLHEARADALAQGNLVVGTLRIASTWEFGAIYLGPVACGLMKQFAQLKVRIDVVQTPISPLEHDYDIAFAMLEDGLPASSLVQRRMISLDRGVFASPELLQQFDEPGSPQDLVDLPLLCATKDSAWTFIASDGTIGIAGVNLESRSDVSGGIDDWVFRPDGDAGGILEDNFVND